MCQNPHFFTIFLAYFKNLLYLCTRKRYNVNLGSPTQTNEVFVVGRAEPPSTLTNPKFTAGLVCV